MKTKLKSSPAPRSPRQPLKLAPASVSPVHYQSARSLLGSEIAISKILDRLMFGFGDTDELLAKAGIQRYQLRALEMDDEVEQCLETRRDSLAAYSWSLEPNQTRAAKTCTDILTPFVHKLMAEMMYAIAYGYVVHEIVWTEALVGNRAVIKPLRISRKPMEWFLPLADGSLRFFPEDGTGGLAGIPCDPRKFLLTTHNATYQNPRGEAMLSRLWFPVTWRREGWGMWMHFLETFGDPIVLGQVPDFRGFVEAMKAQGVRSTIAWQSTSDRDNVSTITASAPGEFERLENAILRRIQKLLLGQTLTSDVSQQGGSYAAATVHNQVRHDKTRADLRMVCNNVQNLVDVCCALNRWPALKFKVNDESELSTVRASRDAVLFPVLSGSGFKLSKTYFQDTYDYRDQDLIEKVGGPPSVTPNQTGSADPAAVDPAPAETPQRSVADSGPEGQQAKQGVPVGAPKANQ